MSLDREREHIVQSEIERPRIQRKFLVESIPQNLDQFSFHDIRQAYVVPETLGTSVFVREEKVSDTEVTRTLTIKQYSASSLEKSIGVTEEEFEQWWQASEGRQIVKRRYLIPTEDVVANLDIYAGNLTGFVTADVQFDSPFQSATFVPPEWFGADVTKSEGDYTNLFLATRGLPPQELHVQSPEILVSPELERGIGQVIERIGRRLQETDEPVVVFVAGRTGAGKSSAITHEVIRAYGEDNTLVLSMDDYFGGDKRMEALRETIPDINWDHPAYLEEDLVREHLRALLSGQEIEQPRFDFKTSEPKPERVPTSLGGKRVLIVEGIHALNDDFAEFEGIRVFVDISLHGSVIRRLLRDGSRTSLDLAQILGYYLRVVEPMYQQYVAPTKQRADVVVLNEYDPHYESRSTGLQDRQLKYRATVSERALQAIGAQHIASVFQSDHYFAPQDGKMVDEFVRIRFENDKYILTYKGPLRYEGSVAVRSKLEFLLDEDTAKRFLEGNTYGRMVKRVEKHRDIYHWRSAVLSRDQVQKYEGDEDAGTDLGDFLEVRTSVIENQEETRKLLQILCTQLRIESNPELTPYAEM